MTLAIQSYPWHSTPWQQLQSMVSQNRLPHALIIGGVPGLGKLAFAQRLATALICRQPVDGEACGECKSCKLLQAGSHPDLIQLQPLEAGKAILVDQVRQALATLSNTSQQGGARVVIINCATDLNLNSANALLKQLEEPGDNNYFLLLHPWPRPLLPTVVSRSQQLEMPVPQTQVALSWLAQHMDDDTAAIVLPLAKGAPLQALCLYEDKTHEVRHQMLVQLTAILRGKQSPIAVAASWQKLPLAQALTWWVECLNDLIKLKLTQDPSVLVNSDLLKLLQAVAKRSDIGAIYALLDEVTVQLNYLQQRRNLNAQSMCEDLLNSWFMLVSTGDNP